MRSRGPFRILLLMTLSAPRAYPEDVLGLQAHLFWDISAQVSGEPADILQVKSGVERKHVSVAVGTGNVAVGRRVPICVGLPDFMAARAGSAAGVLIIEAPGWQDQKQKDGHGPGEPSKQRIADSRHAGTTKGSDSGPGYARPCAPFHDLTR